MGFSRSVATFVVFFVSAVAHELAVEPDFAAAVVFALDQHQVPVDATAVAVVGFVVRLAGREVKAAADLFVEQRVEHRMANMVVRT